MLYLSNYQDWKYCITVHCDTPLTIEYVEQRLAALDDPSDYGTQRFIAAWGHEHLARVTGWFKQAQHELQLE